MARRSNKIVHEYKPRGAASALFHHRGRQIIMSGPAGTGKTRAILQKIHMMLLLTPNARGLLVRKTLASLGSTGLVTWRQKVAKEAIDTGIVTFFGGSAQEPPQYKYTNGSVLVIGGMDKSTKIMSSEYDVIAVIEATECTEDDWEALTTRLRNNVISFQQLIGDCNPDKPTHWLKTRADNGQTVMLFSSHKDNPVLFDDDGEPTEFGKEYTETLNKLTGVRKLRLSEGIWAAADGLIYDEIDPAVHFLDREDDEGNFIIPDSWTRSWTVDFGYTNPFVCQFWAQDPDGRLYLYREIYFSRRTVEEHCETIAHLVMDEPKKVGDTWRGVWKEKKPSVIICDHDAEGRAVFERALGLGTKNAHKAVTEGIQAVQGRIRPAGDGKPRIFFLRDSVVEIDQKLKDVAKPTSTIDELSGYVWEDKGKEAPKKLDDHGMDATRYRVAESDLGRRPRVSSFSF